MIDVKFPSLNKNNTLQDNDIEILRDVRIVNCAVIKLVELTDKEWQEVTTSFMNDNPLWANIGGSVITELRKSPREMPTCVTLVVKVVHKDTKEVFYVNAEGCNYAKYVGRDINESYRKAFITI